MTEEEILELGAHDHEVCLSGASYDKGHDHYCDVVLEGCDDFECIKAYAITYYHQKLFRRQTGADDDVELVEAAQTLLEGER